VHSKPRILLYSHDTFGLGHLRRSLSIAKQIARDIPGSHQLLVTGSMVAGAFGLPPRLDMVKLPALSKRSSGKYKSRALPITLKQTIAWREQMILQAAINFKPDLVLVDKGRRCAGRVIACLAPPQNLVARHKTSAGHARY
jgi:predicted glycosyltransferase